MAYLLVVFFVFPSIRLVEGAKKGNAAQAKPGVVVNGQCSQNSACGHGLCVSGACSCEPGWCLNKNGSCDIPKSDYGRGQCPDPLVECEPGYIFIEGYGCGDINECNVFKGGCQDMCINNMGGYSCSCFSGRSLGGDKRTCTGSADVQNLCAGRDFGGCSHGCRLVSSYGPGYECTCPPNFVLLPDGQTCRQISRCSDTRVAADNGGCQHLCIDVAVSDIRVAFNAVAKTGVVDGTACGCFPGFELRSDGVSCQDFDECATKSGLGPCDQKCANFYAGYACSCYDGFLLLPDAVSCIDINECLSGMARCSDGCVNLVPGYQCTCPPGHVLSPLDNATCQDKNECAINNGGCDATAVCVNSVGSFSCTCPVGFELTDAKAGGGTGAGSPCVDLNECETGAALCSGAVCVNTRGSFSCSCIDGYEPAFSGQMSSGSAGMSLVCRDKNECAAQTPGNPLCTNSVCVNLDPGFACLCNPGFYSLPDAPTVCYDINECITEKLPVPSEDIFSLAATQVDDDFIKQLVDIVNNTVNGNDYFTHGPAPCSHICVNTPGDFFWCALLCAQLPHSMHNVNNCNHVPINSSCPFGLHLDPRNSFNCLPPITNQAIVVNGEAIECSLFTFDSPFVRPPLLFLALDHRYASPSLPPHAPAAIWGTFVTTDGFEACVAPLLLDPALYVNLPVSVAAGAGAGGALVAAQPLYPRAAAGGYSPAAAGPAPPPPYISTGPLARVSYFAIDFPDTAPLPVSRRSKKGRRGVGTPFPAANPAAGAATSSLSQLTAAPIVSGEGYAKFEAGYLSLQPDGWVGGVQCFNLELRNAYAGPPMVVLSLDHQSVPAGTVEDPITAWLEYIYPDRFTACAAEVGRWGDKKHAHVVRVNYMVLERPAGSGAVLKLPAFMQRAGEVSFGSFLGTPSGRSAIPSNLAIAVDCKLVNIDPPISRSASVYGPSVPVEPIIIVTAHHGAVNQDVAGGKRQVGSGSATTTSSLSSPSWLRSYHAPVAVWLEEITPYGFRVCIDETKPEADSSAYPEVHPPVWIDWFLIL